VAEAGVEIERFGQQAEVQELFQIGEDQVPDVADDGGARGGRAR
jgi:hypothetical protein